MNKTVDDTKAKPLKKFNLVIPGRLSKLETLPDIRRELRAVYRGLKYGKTPESVARAAATILHALANIIRNTTMEDLEERIKKLEEYDEKQHLIALQ